MQKTEVRNIICAWGINEGNKEKNAKNSSIAFKSKIVPKVKRIVKNEQKLVKRKSLSEFIASRCSVHGVQFIFDSELHSIEKLIWLIFLSIFIFFTAQEMGKIISNFQAAPTAVVVDSPSYRVSFLSFPSVTVCPKKRIDWTKAMLLEKQIIPANDSRTIKLYRELINVLSMMAFANFAEMEHFFEEDIANSKLAHLNITDILYKTVPNCESLFSNCTWSYQNATCCEIFHLQKTLYGFCYSFNSARSESNEYLNKFVPKKTAAYGSLSGLTFTFHLGKVKFPPDINHNFNRNVVLSSGRNDEHLRALLLIQGSETWPISGEEIKSGIYLSVKIECLSSYATDEVLDLPSSKVPCQRSNFPSGRKYSFYSCLAKCKQMHAMRYCQCNPSFYFPQNGTRDCKIRDLNCLYKNNDRFKDYQMPGDNDYLNNNIMNCDCRSACDYTNYDTNFNAVPIDEKDDIIMDIYYRGPTSIRYKRKLIFNKLYLLVYTGGIFGLFVGGSIISVLEIMYLFIIGVLRKHQRHHKENQKRLKS